MNRLTANLLMLFAASIWGLAFVAQATAMQAIGPIWFLGIRFLLAALVIAPFALNEKRRSPTPISRPMLGLIGLITVAFFAASMLQQIAMLGATVTNAGFLTGLYVPFTPLIGILIFREWPHVLVWPCAALALAGTWLLSGGISTLGWADGLLILSAIAFAIQMLLMGHAVPATGRPVTITFLQMLATGALGCLVAPFFELISWEAIRNAGVEILYAGVLSGGLAYTLQAVGQRYTPAADAAIVLSSEAPFAAIFGVLLLGERINPVGLLGCAMIFAAIVMVQVGPMWRTRPAAVPEPQ